MSTMEASRADDVEREAVHIIRSLNPHDNEIQKVLTRGTPKKIKGDQHLRGAVAAVGYMIKADPSKLFEQSPLSSNLHPKFEKKLLVEQQKLLAEASARHIK